MLVIGCWLLAGLVVSGAEGAGGIGQPVAGLAEPGWGLSSAVGERTGVGDPSYRSIPDNQGWRAEGGVRWTRGLLVRGCGFGVRGYGYWLLVAGIGWGAAERRPGTKNPVTE